MNMSQSLPYLIVDDEPIAHRIILDYAAPLPHLVCAGQCYNPLQALPLLLNQHIDLVFLDLHMPEMQGFDFLKSLAAPPQIIVTTAYEQHALEGHELQVVDYLLKPFTHARFLKAVQKVRRKPNPFPWPNPQPSATHGSVEKVFIKGDKTHHYVAVRGIERVEAFGNTCLVHIGKQIILTPQKISDLAEAWEPFGFVRAHKSHLVSRHFIEAISSKSLTVRGQEIPIGMAYKRALHQALGLK